MRNNSVLVIFVFLVFFSVPTITTYADEQNEFNTVLTTTSFRFNNDNWLTVDHPRISTFTVHADGSSEGSTETGITFLQYNIPNDYGIRIQRFEIQDHYHYIIDGEIAYTTSELSARLAEVYSHQMQAQQV